MEPMMKDKRASADLIPYRREGEQWMFYLQKRDANAERAPNKIALFGGGLEADESIEAALARECMEELKYVPGNPTYFSKYETAKSHAHIFIEEVGTDFESLVTVQEGEYGLFLSADEVTSHPDVTPFTKLVIFHLMEVLRN